MDSLAAQTREITRKYWKSWQIMKPEDMDATVAEEYQLYLYGEPAPGGKKALLVTSFQTPPWEQVTMLSEVYSERDAAIHYKGIDTHTKEPVLVSEFLRLNDERRIATNYTIIYPNPAQHDGGLRPPYVYLELWRARPSWWRLPVDERRRLMSQIQPQGIPGANVVGLAINEANQWRAPYDYFSVWQVDTVETIRRVEMRVAAVDWWQTHWEEVHAWGKDMVRDIGDTFANEMINPTRSRGTFTNSADQASPLAGLAMLCNMPFQIPLEVLKAVLGAVDAVRCNGKHG